MKNTLSLTLAFTTMLAGLSALVSADELDEGPEVLWERYESAWAEYLAADKTTASAATALSKAQKALAALETVESKSPTARTQEAIADLILAEVGTFGVPDQYTTNLFARSRLGRAASLAPNDLRLQIKAIRPFNKMQAWTAAIECAKRIIAHPDGKQQVDAHFALASEAVWFRRDDAEKRLKALQTLDDRPIVKTLVLEVEQLKNAAEATDNAADKTKLQNACDEACKLLLKTNKKGEKTFTNAMVAGMDDLDFRSLDYLLINAVRHSDDAKSAHRRTTDVFKSIRRIRDMDLALEWCAYTVSRLLHFLHEKHPNLSLDGVEMENRNMVTKIAAEFLRDAIASGVASEFVYFQLANLEIGEENRSEAAKILAAGIDASNKKLQPVETVLDLHLLAAKNLMVLKRWDDAKQHLAVLKAIKLSAGWAYLLAGEIAKTEGREALAVQEFEKARQYLGITQTVMTALGDAYITNKDWEKALAHIEELAAINVEDHLVSQLKQQVAWQRLRVTVALQDTNKELLAEFGIDDPKDEIKKQQAVLKGTSLETKSRLLPIEYQLNR